MLADMRASRAQNNSGEASAPLLEGAERESVRLWGGRTFLCLACIGSLCIVGALPLQIRLSKGLSLTETALSTEIRDSPSAILEGQQGFECLNVLDRSVWLFGPPGLPDRDRKAVIVLHGSEDTPANIARSSRFHEVAARTSPGFYVLYPEMAVPGSDEWGYGAPWEKRFFRTLVDTLQAQFMTNPSEVYIVGHSCGGTMALFLQNNMPGVFRGAGAVEAGVGHLDQWAMTNSGSRTIIVWNHNDPVLHEYGGDTLLQTTVGVLQRQKHPHVAPHVKLPLPAGYSGVDHAQKWIWKENKTRPRLTVVSWASTVPTHSWVNHINVKGAPLDASMLIYDFFHEA